MYRSKKHRLGVAAVGLSAVLTLAACSSGDSEDTAATAEATEEVVVEESATEDTTQEEAEAAEETCVLPPGDIKVVSIDSMTGPAAFAGILAEKGADLALKEINASGVLGDGVTMSIELLDDATSPDEAAAQFSKAAKDPDVPVIMGGVISSGAVVTSPIAEKEKVAVVYTQAGSPGVVIGDYTFRYTPPMDSYWGGVGSYIEEKGIKTMSVLYANDNPTLIATAETALPALAADLGFELLSSTGLPSSTQDFKAPISKILKEDPDAVAVLMVGAQNATVVSQMRESGWEAPKELLGFAGIENNFADIGEAATGVTWASIFHVDSPAQSTQAFVDAVAAEYDGEVASNYTAERYDATYLVANSILAACSTERQAVRDAMSDLTNGSLTGALGDVTFENQDARVAGFVVQWDGEKMVVLK
jgi:branched-chain amino acid transport system substrate-binding protein